MKETEHRGGVVYTAISLSEIPRFKPRPGYPKKQRNVIFFINSHLVLNEIREWK
jgi:hypothetical protein